jgi:hypothetical protein
MTIEVLSQSNWVDYVDFNHDSGEVSTGTSFTIHFTRTIAVASLLSDNFRIYDVGAAAFLLDPWMGIVTDRDFSFINQVLDIYLELPLETETTYQFTIQDLEDGAGNTMPTTHTIQFDTSPVPSPVEFRLDALPTYIDDQSIVQPDVAEETGSEHLTDLYVDETSPPDGTMQVDVDDTSQVIIRFTDSLAPLDGGDVTVYTRTIDRLWHPYVDITDDLTIEVSDTDIIITFTIDATPTNHYLDYNTEYKIVLDESISNLDATPVTMGSAYTLTFYSEFQPLYLDPLELAEQFPDLSIEELYLAVYKASMDAYRFSGSLDLSYTTMVDIPYAAQEYTRLRALYLTAMSSEETASRMQLADLMIASDTSWMDNLKEEMDRWQYELEILGGSKRLASFTKAAGLVPPPEEIAPTSTTTLKKYTGGQTRRRNDWYD